MMHDWNVVVTAHREGFADTCRILGAFGAVHRTDYFNVLVMRVDDPTGLLEALRARLEEEPGLLNFVSHVTPVEQAFDFDSPGQFEARAHAVLEQWLDRLAGRCFHVRMHRRGFKGRLSSQEEEQALDHFIRAGLERQGSAAEIDFDDPDVIVDVETVGQRAGLALWQRADLERYHALLGVD